MWRMGNHSGTPLLFQDLPADVFKGGVLAPGRSLVVERVGRAVDDRHHQRGVVRERLAPQAQGHALTLGETANPPATHQP